MSSADIRRMLGTGQATLAEKQKEYRDPLELPPAETEPQTGIDWEMFIMTPSAP